MKMEQYEPIFANRSSHSPRNANGDSKVFAKLSKLKDEELPGWYVPHEGLFAQYCETMAFTTRFLVRWKWIKLLNLSISSCV